MGIGTTPVGPVSGYAPGISSWFFAPYRPETKGGGFGEGVIWLARCIQTPFPNVPGKILDPVR